MLLCSLPYCLDWPSVKLRGKFPIREHFNVLAKTFTEGNIYRIPNVKIPVLDKADENLFFSAIV